VDVCQGDNLESCVHFLSCHGRCSFAVAVVVAVACDIHAERHLAKAGGSNCKLRGLPTLVMEQGVVERAKRSGGLHKRSAEDWGHGLWARGAELLSVLSTCVTKQTRDMRYSERERL
jgi:hypothetical protein